MTPAQFLAYLQQQVREHGSQKALAQTLGVSEAFLSDVLRGRRDPGAKILLALGFHKVLSYEED